MNLKEKRTKYLKNVYRYLSIRNRSEKEVRDYLAKKQASEEIIAHIIQLLKKQKFLDDVAFARSWILSRSRLKPKGTHVLKMELVQKGIAKETITTVLEEVAGEVPDQLTQAKKIIEKRMERLKGASRQEIFTRVGGFLTRRGFDWETTKKAIESSIKRE